jgi:NADH:ubiquinone oxidoreductase subunit 2 (subunit N)
MEYFIHYILVYLITVVPLTAVIFVVFRFFLKMREWYASDWIMLVIPGAIYIMMEKLRPDRLISMRVLENIDASIAIGILCALIFLIRCFSARKRREDAKKFSYLSVIVMTIATIIVLMVAPPFTNR